MNNGVIVDRIAERIRDLAVQERADLEAGIEAVLLREFEGLTQEERLRRVEELARCFVSASQPVTCPGGTSGEAADFLSLLLGTRLTTEGLSGEEVTRKTMEAFTTIFDTLNRIHSVIQSTLLGRGDELETIRQVIGAQIGREAGTSSVKEYLDKIQEAFLVAHRSFQSAAGAVISEMLKEMDPAAIEASAENGFRFGPLRKARLYDLYRERYEVLTKWAASGYFNESLLREFEKSCQRSYRP